MNFVERLLHERYEDLRLAEFGVGRDLRAAVLTPRFITSRHVVALVFSEASPGVRLVAKVPRRPGDDSGIRREAVVLRALADPPDAPVSGVPRLVAAPDESCYPVLLETALQGPPLDPARVKRDLPAAVVAGERFVATLPSGPPFARGENWLDEHLLQPVDALLNIAEVADRRQLSATTQEVLEPLRELDLPSVLQHGDLSHPNLLLDPYGKLQVLDWERATIKGLPGHDLIFYLTYLNESACGAHALPGQLRAVDEAFVAPSGWARPILERYLRSMGVDPRLLPQLIVACWARTAATLVDRLLSARPGGSVSDLDEGTRRQFAAAACRDRDVALWRHTLRRVHETL